MRAERCFTTEELAGYSAGGGSSAWRRRVEQHLAGCPSCSSELAAYKGVDDLLNQATKRSAPDLWHSIAPHLVPTRRSWFHPIAAFPRRVYAATVAVAAVMVAAVLLWQSPVQQPAPSTNAVTLEHADSHVTMTWTDPFADRVSLAVIHSRVGEQEHTQ